jgi:3-oxoacyl-[acyl-carrier-protein] synthase II
MAARVAITGLGAVTPVGNDAATTWRSLVQGKSGVGPITTFPATSFPVKIAGLVKDFDFAQYVSDPRSTRHLYRAGQFAVAAAAQAVEDAGMANGGSGNGREIGIAMGGSMGRPRLEELVEMSCLMRDSDGRELYRQPPSMVLERDQNVASAQIARRFGFEGPILSVSTACTASAHSIGEGFRLIQEGDARAMLTGGHDSLTTWFDVLGFGLLGALTKDHVDEPERASRPFDAERSGFVLGEGAVMVLLENLDAARARGARVYAEVVGYGSSLNAYRMTDPPPEGGGVTLAIEKALDDSGMERDTIDYVVAHGTSTPGNDKTETLALKQAFGDHAMNLAISSNKSMTGHLTCAAGALNVLVGARAIEDQVVPPTINYEHPDPECDLDYVPNEARQLSPRGVLVNAFAFGGTNGCLVLRRVEDE